MTAGHPGAIFPRKLLRGEAFGDPRQEHADALRSESLRSIPEVMDRWATNAGGLSQAEADRRLQLHGPNVLAKDHRPSVLRLLQVAFFNPLVLLLAVLGLVSFATGDVRAGSLIVLMIGLGVGLRLFQEARAGSAAARLKSLIAVSATALRDGESREIPVSQLVPGDVVQLAAGDMVPADLRLVSARDLFVVQSSLTGESFPVEKATDHEPDGDKPCLELSNMAYLGTSVATGSATGVVVATGASTYLGSVAESLAEEEPPSAFDRGVERFTWLMVRLVSVMVPLVFLVHGVTRGDWVGAFFFAIAVAVGLTPEMLPMIVSVCLSQGALAMSRRKVIVKHLASIQNLGAMDVLCTDKTGTLTWDRVILERHCDVMLRESNRVLGLAYLNSHFQTGLRNVLDRAVLAHVETHADARVPDHAKVDEIPFDFERRIMSVVVRTPEGLDLLVSKGAPEAIFPRCDRFELDGDFLPMDHAHLGSLQQEYERLSADGFRVLAIASKTGPPRGAFPGQPAPQPYSRKDEVGLTLHGYVAFLDPPKESARAAIRALEQRAIVVKVITGDNELVARKICREVGLSVQRTLLGSEVDAMDDEQLAEAAVQTELFARVAPVHKQRILRALQSRGHTVGFMGDGINDALALRTADVGISVDTAVDVAKESADMILLEKSLLVLEAGVVEGRKVFANILKYVRMGASSNFGNMFSVLGAAAFVPFLPMAPLQILANNLLYDISQMAIPSDNVDEDQIRKPLPWDIRGLTRFILCFGPCSSIFDYTTFLIMLYGFNCWDTQDAATARHSEQLFQTGWFVESVLTQSLVIHVIRTMHVPFLRSWPSPLLLLTTSLIALAGAWLPSTALGEALGFVPLPSAYWPLLLVTVCGYGLAVLGLKTWLARRGWI